ncbi:(2Fe-2S)-binding protein [Aquincola sp. S2]|uniref:Bacterioferritin-associated ferredoxin n=1 Tax=Pseudaquabacterium terrae TaxID=2732868 RepID=A0ABX2EE33_9BURK|nr:(2Fe-2S)-binding protein [Aquabacterium terrae]NRF66864.1 (2Fe-2S)-binding protein [Aquabacterium terrae]
MIVCICRRVSDRDIQHAVREGIASFDVLQDETGVASHCGACHDCAHEVFEEARAAAHGGCAGACHAGTKVISIATAFAT